MTDSLIERMARAAFDNRAAGGMHWENVGNGMRQAWISDMRAAWAVAAEPTEPMDKAGGAKDFAFTAGNHRAVWQAMHGAADD